MIHNINLYIARKSLDRMMIRIPYVESVAADSALEFDSIVMGRESDFSKTAELADILKEAQAKLYSREIVNLHSAMRKTNKDGRKFDSREELDVQTSLLRLELENASKLYSRSERDIERASMLVDFLFGWCTEFRSEADKRARSMSGNPYVHFLAASPSY